MFKESPKVMVISPKVIVISSLSNLMLEQPKVLNNLKFEQLIIQIGNILISLGFKVTKRLATRHVGTAKILLSPPSS